MAPLDHSLVAGYTLPASWYTDPDVLRLEQERIFRRSWQYAGRADQVEEPGDYVTCRAGDIPVVVVRDRSRELRAYVNVCRHRGHEVVSGAGNRKTLQCPYHAWTYALDGSLSVAPRAEREPAFDDSELSLLPVAVAAWGPFLFVNPDANAAPLVETLGDVPRLLSAGGVDVASLRFHHRAESDLAANWKICVENFLECYHCAVAHPDFSEVVDVGPDAYRLQVDGRVLSQFVSVRAPTPEHGPRAYDPLGAVAHGQFHLLWPNVALNVMPGHANVSIGPVLPVAPDRTLRFLDYFFAEGTPDEWIAEMIAFDAQVGREDTPLVESVHRGLRAGIVERGRLLPESEKLVAAFQALVDDAVAGARV